uniref:Uncharacterized protein n=1 Tax=uncultured prokaryote TaxID=198431 RepID=A0A0H5Q5G1_9ZZZZ|nr:hypothetical protein [uncultured prokaryote]
MGQRAVGGNVWGDTLKRQITLTITETSRGVSNAVRVTEDGRLIVAKKSTRNWGEVTAKSPDDYLVRALFGAVNIEVRSWMQQEELPF